MSCCDDGECHEQKQEQNEHHHDEACNHPNEEAIQQLSEEEQLRLKRQRIARRRLANQQNKKKYQPLLKFLKKNGLKFKTAGVDKNSIEYFRMDHFKAFLKQKKELINANATIRQLLNHWEEIFIYYDRYENQPHFKWPQLLAPSNRGTNSKFASFSFESAESSKWKASLVLLAVIGVVLFPLWPFELKYYLWLMSYYLFITLVGIIILRWIVYMFCSIFGASIWIFPRLFDNVEFLQSFTPFLSAKKWEGSTIYSIVTRMLIFSIFAYYGYHIYIDPSIVKQNLGITKTIMDDLNDWGISKIKGQKNFSQSALTDYSKLLNATQEENDDIKIVGFTSIHEGQQL